VSWQETRGTGGAARATVHAIAHRDDAKVRTDETSQVVSHSTSRVPLPKQALLVGGVAGAVLVGGGVVYAAVGRDASPKPPQEPVAAAVSTEPSPTMDPSEAAAQVLAESQPSGKWRLKIVPGKYTTRDGVSHKIEGDPDPPVTWTFPSGDCSDRVCSGVVTSSSGRTFPFRWNGRRLVVDNNTPTERSGRLPCVDPETGEKMPVAESSFATTDRYSFEPFTGSATSMTAVQRMTRDTKVFGTCEVSDEDVMDAYWTWKLTSK